MKDVNRCPICGISAPRVLDHHLPKSQYHPLAIYVCNLVPLCAECNQFKGALAADNPAERFIHPYFEILPEGRFLSAEVGLVDGGLIADFGVDPSAELTVQFANRLAFQLRRLRLNDRYAQEINICLSSHTTALHMSSEFLGADGVRKFLRRQAATEFAQYHPNFWRPVLLTALAEFEEFCAGGFAEILPQAAAPEPLAP